MPKSTIERVAAGVCSGPQTRGCQPGHGAFRTAQNNVWAHSVSTGRRRATVTVEQHTSALPGCITYILTKTAVAPVPLAARAAGTRSPSCIGLPANIPPSVLICATRATRYVWRCTVRHWEVGRSRPRMNLPRAAEVHDSLHAERRRPRSNDSSLAFTAVPRRSPSGADR